MELTKEQISDINSAVGSDQGVFTEPWAIDVNEHRLVVYQRIETGGCSGGSCWGTEAKRYENDITEELENWTALDYTLEILAPHITYLQYKKLMKLVKSNEETSYQYYGNYDDYLIRWIPVDEIIEFVIKNNIN